MQTITGNPASVAIWLDQTVQLMVDKPHRVKVTTERARVGFVFRVDVAKDDLGKVIGTNGMNAEGIRRLVRMMAKTHKRTYSVDLGSVERQKMLEQIERVRERKNANAASLEAFEKIMLAKEEEEVAFA